jgi:uncharacterized iron-regulated membrane protein
VPTTELPDQPTAKAPTQTYAQRIGWFRALGLRIHFYAGILVGPFIFVAALSGAIYAFMPQIEKAVYSHELSVPASSAAQPAQPLSAQVAAAQKIVPGAVYAVRPAPTPGDTTRVVFTAVGADGGRKTVFIDPATLEVRGEQTMTGSVGTLPVRAWFRALHRNLHMGDFGALYSELAASWLWIVALGGVILWLTKKKKSSTRLRNWHGALGLWVAAGLIGLSATGLVLSNYAADNIKPFTAAPTVSTKLKAGVKPVPAMYDHVLLAARADGISAAKIEIKPSAKAAWTVAEIDRSFPSKLDVVAVNPTTAKITDKVEFSQWPLLAKLARWGSDAHMGELFGIFNQIVLVLIALATALLTAWGYLMWWKRRPRFLPKAPGMPWQATACGLILAVAVGAFLPLFGIPLLAFLLIDTGLRLRKSA